MTKAKKSKRSRTPKATQAIATPKTRAPKRTDKELVVELVAHLKPFDGAPRSIEQVYQATRIDWYTVKRLFQGNPRIFEATSETRRARFALTAAAAKAKTS